MENQDKSQFINTIQTIFLILSIIGVIILFIMGEYILAVTGTISAIIFFVLLEIFKVIIELLQSIDDKLEKK